MAASKAFTVELSGSYGLRNAAELAATLKAAIESHPSMVIAAGGVTDIDISAVQVLVAARKSAVKSGKSLSLDKPAAGPLRDVLVKAGFIGPSGEPLTAESEFWTGSAGRSKGKAA